MPAVDWSSVGWWDLPGPSRFILGTAARVLSERSGLLALSLPRRRPKRLIERLAGHVEEEGLRVVVVNVGSLDAATSPAHALASAAGAQPATIRSTRDFVSAPDLDDVVFIVDGLTPDRWASWGLFMRAFRSEREREGRLASPRLTVVEPNELLPADVAAALGPSRAQWRGGVARTDMQLYVEGLLGVGEDLAHRTAVATVTEMACWDPEVADQLAAQKLEDQLNPHRLLTSSGAGGFGALHWANGLVDLWDGEPHVHTLGLLQPGGDEQLKRRIWRAHVQTIFPAVEQVRQAFVRAHIDILGAHMPFEKSFNSSSRIYSDPMTLEINDVAYLLREHLSREQAQLLHAFKELRKSMAHMEPADPRLIIDASNAWRQLLAEIDYPLEAPSWRWPRCGQRLTLLVGPSGAGKSTYASRTYLPDEVISSDVIREEIFGTIDMAGGHERVFGLVRARARARLEAGLGAVIDATNLRQGERLANATVAPGDMGVEYVVIDRPPADKHRDAGWRSERPNLIDGHAQMFARELPQILAGDGLPNVTVHDLRAATAAES